MEIQAITRKLDKTPSVDGIKGRRSQQKRDGKGQ